MKSKIFLFGLSIISVSACGVYESKGSNPSAESAAITANPSTAVTYAEINQLILTPSCVSCHGGGTPQGGISLTSYSNVNAIIDTIKNDIASGDMPQVGTLSTNQIALFNQWYAQGHTELGSSGGSTSTTPTPIPTATPVVPTGSSVTYAQINTALFAVSCLRCHSPSSESGGILVDTFAHVTSNLSRIESAINSGSMPEGTPLTSSQKSMLSTWIAEGAPQN